MSFSDILFGSEGRQSSTTDTQNNAQNAAASFGTTGSDSSSSSQSSSSQSIAFEELFKKLYGDASGSSEVAPARMRSRAGSETPPRAMRT